MCSKRHTHTHTHTGGTDTHSHVFNSFSPSTAFVTLPSKPSSVQLCHTQTHALQAKMNRVEKSFLNDATKRWNNQLKMEAIGLRFLTVH